eukprot:scaffold109456_cov45-Phaeocystis_antarctica.AAC.1
MHIWCGHGARHWPLAPYVSTSRARQHQDEGARQAHRPLGIVPEATVRLDEQQGHHELWAE